MKKLWKNEVLFVNTLNLFAVNFSGSLFHLLLYFGFIRMSRQQSVATVDVSVQPDTVKLISKSNLPSVIILCRAGPSNTSLVSLALSFLHKSQPFSAKPSSLAEVKPGDSATVLHSDNTTVITGNLSDRFINYTIQQVSCQHQGTYICKSQTSVVSQNSTTPTPASDVKQMDFNIQVTQYHSTLGSQKIKMVTEDSSVTMSCSTLISEPGAEQSLNWTWQHTKEADQGLAVWTDVIGDDKALTIINEIDDSNQECFNVSKSTFTIKRVTSEESGRFYRCYVIVGNTAHDQFAGVYQLTVSTDAVIAKVSADNTEESSDLPEGVLIGIIVALFLVAILIAAAACTKLNRSQNTQFIEKQEGKGAVLTEESDTGPSLGSPQQSVDDSESQDLDDLDSITSTDDTADTLSRSSFSPAQKEEKKVFQQQPEVKSSGVKEKSASPSTSILKKPPDNRKSPDQQSLVSASYTEDTVSESGFSTDEAEEEKATHQQPEVKESGQKPKIKDNRQQAEVKDLKGSNASDIQQLGLLQSIFGQEKSKNQEAKTPTPTKDTWTSPAEQQKAKELRQQPEEKDLRQQPEVKGPQQKPEVKGPQQKSEVKGPQQQPEVKGPQQKPEVKGPQQKPEVKGPQQQSEVKGLQQKLEVKGPQQQPEVKGPQQQPEVKGPQQKPEVKGPQQQPEVKEPQQKPEVKGPQQQPEVKGPQQKPEVKGPQQQPEVKGPQQKPEVKGPQQKPEVKGSQQKPEVKGSQQKPEVKGPQQKPEVKRPQQQLEVKELQQQPERNDLRDNQQSGLFQRIFGFGKSQKPEAKTATSTNVPSTISEKSDNQQFLGKRKSPSPDSESVSGYAEDSVTESMFSTDVDESSVVSAEAPLGRGDYDSPDYQYYYD